MRLMPINFATIVKASFLILMLVGSVCVEGVRGERIQIIKGTRHVTAKSGRGTVILDNRPTPTKQIEAPQPASIKTEPSLPSQESLPPLASEIYLPRTNLLSEPVIISSLGREETGAPIELFPNYPRTADQYDQGNPLQQIEDRLSALESSGVKQETPVVLQETPSNVVGKIELFTNDTSSVPLVPESTITPEVIIPIEQPIFFTPYSEQFVAAEDSPKDRSPASVTFNANWPASPSDSVQSESELTPASPATLNSDSSWLQPGISQFVGTLLAMLVGIIVTVPATLFLLRRSGQLSSVIRVEMSDSSGSPLVLTPQSVSTKSESRVDLEQVSEADTDSEPVILSMPSVEKRSGAAVDFGSAGLPLNLLQPSLADQQQEEADRLAEQNTEMMKCVFEANLDLQSQINHLKAG